MSDTSSLNQGKVSASEKTDFDLVDTGDDAGKTGMLVWIIVGVGAVLGFALIIGLFIYFRRKAKKMPEE